MKNPSSDPRRDAHRNPCGVGIHTLVRSPVRNVQQKPGWNILQGAVLALLLAGCAQSTPTETSNPQIEVDLKLEPLPEPPAIQIEQEPGSTGELEIVVARPVGEVYGELRPTITFNAPMVPLETIDSSANKPIPIQITPPLEGAWRWLGSTTLEFIPSKLVPYNTQFSIHLPPGIKSLSGAALRRPYSFEFNTPRPVVQSITPSASFRRVGPNPTFELLLNQPVKDLERHAKLIFSPETTIELKVIKSSGIAEERRAEEGERAFDRADYEQRGFKNMQTRYLLSPVSPLPLNSDFTLEIAPELSGLEGNLTMGELQTFVYRTYGPLVITELDACYYPSWMREDCETQSCECSYGPLVLKTSNPVTLESLKSRLSISPPVAIDWEGVSISDGSEDETGSPYVVIPGAFTPGTRYQVKVAAGVLDEFGQAARAFMGQMRTTDLEPSYSLDRSVALIEAEEDGTLPLESVNIQTVNADVWHLTPADMARALNNYETIPAVPANPMKLDVTGTHNLTRWTPVDLRKSLSKGSKYGLFLAKFSSPDLQTDRPQHVIAQVTDLGVHAKLGATSGLAWVTRISTGEPVSGAQLEMYDAAGMKKWTGTTGKDGIAVIPGLAELLPFRYVWETPYAMLAAKKDRDIGVTLSSWEGSFWPGTFGVQTQPVGDNVDSLGFVVADRGIYRPGDPVYLKGLARYYRLGLITTPPANEQIHVKVTSSRDEVVYEEALRLTRFGTFSTEFELDADLPLGFYSITAEGKVKGKEISYYGSFRVEEYRAPQFTVDVTAPSSEVIAGEPLSASVLARYLFGGAMAGARVQWTASRMSSAFLPPGHSAYEFGVHTWWWDDESPLPSGDIAASGEGEADAVGQLRLDVGAASAPGDQSWEYTIEADVEDVSRQRFADRTTVLVHPAEAYGGLRVGSGGFPEANKPVTLSMIAVSPDGTLKAGQRLGLEVKRREWKNVRKQGAGEQWFTMSEPVETEVFDCNVTSRAEPSTCEFTPAEPGLYLAELTLVDGKQRRQVTRSGFYVVGSGWVSWQQSDSDRVELIPDKTLYDVGETAKVLVKSPFPGAQALVTVEREGVLSHRLVTLEGSASTLEFPLNDGMIPNVYVSVVIVRGRVPGDQGIEVGEDPGRPAVKIGYATLAVEKKRKRLEVAVTPDAPERRPRDKVKVNLKVTDWQGRGTRAEVAVWAVDEGVLRLTGYEVPDPVEAIHPVRGLAVRVSEPLINLVFKRLYGDKGRTAGGSGGMDAFGSGVRNQFRTTAVFAPETVTDEQGNATVEFSLPDNLTTFRIMALAVTEADRFGVGESKIVVNKPLLVLPALPRLARVGDTFEAGVVVHRHGGAARDVVVSTQSEGLTLVGKSSRSVKLIDDKAQEVRFQFRAEKPGTAILRFGVVGGEDRDAVEQRLPIQLPVSMEAVALYGSTETEERQALVPPGGVYPELGGLEVSLASTVLGGFDEGMKQLIDYPYGCLEQLSSRLVPFIALREIFGKFGISSPSPTEADRKRIAFLHAWLGNGTLGEHDLSDPDQVVAETVEAIEQLQNYDGGYRYWPSAECSSSHGSAYAVLALGRAKEVGYSVDEEAFKMGQTFLAEQVAAGKPISCQWGSSSASDATRVFALYSLARTGAPRPSFYGELFKNREKLPVFARAMLADAMFVGGGDREQARKLLQELVNLAQETPGEVHFAEKDPRTYAALWSSDVRTTALILQTLATINPSHPYVTKISRYLTRVRGTNGRFRNTQEAGFGLMGLLEVVRNKEKDTPDYAAQVLLGEQVLTSAEFRGRSTSVAQSSTPMTQLIQQGTAQLPFIFRKQGVGQLYYGALLRYAPRELPTTPLDRGIVVQRWFEPYGGGGQARAFQAGDLVRVRVRVGSPAQRLYVAMEVPLPAGLESVDTTLASSARLSTESEGMEEGYEWESEEDLGDEDPWAGRFYTPFIHTEYRDDRVVFFADELPPGVHTTSFVARATTPGVFILKPARAEEMYAPEVFGRSDGGLFTVVPGAQVASRPAK